MEEKNLDQPEEQNQVSQVDDIFAETENSSAGARNNTQISGEGDMTFSNSDVPEKNEKENFNKSRIRLFLIIALAVILLGVGGYYGYSLFVSKTDGNLEDNLEAEEENKELVNENDNQNNQVINSEEKQQTNQRAETVVEPEIKKSGDSDQDGLSDEEERELGTNVNNIDSDNDGLYDREEVKVYKTNPMDSDTDNDGHSDGDEVKAGYDPNGPGKLYELK